jgi:hypothetical protein
MPANYTRLLVLSLLPLIGGCRGGEEAAGRWTTGGRWPPVKGLKETDLGVVECFGRNDDGLLMVWTDFLGGVHIPTALSGDGLKGAGELKTPTDPRPAIEFDSPQAGQGHVRIDDQTFDLARGRTFYVRHDRGGLTVRQTEHDPKEFLRAGEHGLDTQAVDRFVRTDPEFREFFQVTLSRDTP